VAPVGLE